MDFRRKALYLRKKFFYVPGLLSLVFIPLLLIPGLSKEFPQKLYGLRVLFINEQTVNNDSSFTSIKLPPNRNFHHYTLDGTNDSIKEIKNAINSLHTSKDTINGIHVLFNSNAKYHEFIALVDFCKVIGLNACIPYKNHLYMLIPNNTPIVEVKPTNQNGLHPCGGVRSELDPLIILKSLFKVKSENKIMGKVKNFWPILIGLMGIGIVSLRRVIT